MLTRARVWGRPGGAVWLLTRPGVSSVIIGARHADQLADTLAAVRKTPYPIWPRRKTVTELLYDPDKVLPLSATG